MKKTLLFSLAMFCTTLLFAQPVLREKSHGVLPGYKNPMILTKFTDPGLSGEDILWDFSMLPQIAPFNGDVLSLDQVAPLATKKKVNSILLEDGLQSLMVSSRKALKIYALRSENDRMVRLYEEPVMKMKYPFAYGDAFSGVATGKEIYSSNYQFDVQVNYDVQADAYGTLILPGTTLKDVLRVKTLHSVTYDQNGVKSNSRIVTYRWYVKEHRYPVLSLIFREKEDGTLLPLKGAYNPIVQMREDAKAKPEVTVAKESAKVSDVQVTPNPFVSALRVNYTLQGSSNVTIALYDIKGGLAATLFQGRQQEGQYERTFTNRVQQLPAGLYIVRVEAAGSVLSQKVIKVN